MRADGIREVLGVDVGPTEDVAVWRAFLQGRVARGVRLNHQSQSGRDRQVHGLHTKQGVGDASVAC